MTILPVATGARLLGIHPKTLHHWLGEAHFSLAAHPTDARVKCVAEEHPPSGSQTARTSPPGSSLRARVTRGASKACACT
jgi:hypothetical protein